MKFSQVKTGVGLGLVGLTIVVMAACGGVVETGSETAQ